MLAMSSTNCRTQIVSVQTEVVALSDGFGAAAADRPEPRRAAEKWVVGLCGATESFAVMFAPSAQGGTDIRVMPWKSPQNPMHR